MILKQKYTKKKLLEFIKMGEDEMKKWAEFLFECHEMLKDKGKKK